MSISSKNLFTAALAGMAGSLAVIGSIVFIASYQPTWIAQALGIPSMRNTSNLSTNGTSNKAISLDDLKELDREQLIENVVERVSPAVVSITVQREVSMAPAEDIPFFDPFEDFFGMPNPFGSPFQNSPQSDTDRKERVDVGGGTGFLISGDGYIVTNRHVVESRNATYAVMTGDGTEHDATVIAKDPVLDIAILKIDANNLPYLQFGDSDGVKVGQTAIAIGNALAEFRNTVSVGVISGIARSIQAGDNQGNVERLENVLQTDAAINPGNSGGPLLDIRGNVIGVNVAMAGGSENIGFALPSNIVREVAESVRTNGKIIRPFLGVRYVPITKSLKEKNGLSVDYGVLVLRGADETELAVTPGSAADKAGIVEHDIILNVDGQNIDDTHTLASLIRSKHVGDRITLNILHKGEEKYVTAELQAYPDGE